MRNTSLWWKAVLASLVVILASVLATGRSTILFVQAASPDVVISQVYGGGGNTDATYTNDFIELFNRGTTTVNLADWSVQYASAAGTSWQVTTLSGSLAPGQYYLVQEAAGAGGTTGLPTPDATGGIAMSATAGKVAVVNSTTELSGSGCPFDATIVDFVGFGTTANCSETASAPAPSNTTADLRAANGCTETDNNSTDFATSAPNPRNTSASLNLCGGGVSLSINDVSVTEGNSGTINAAFTVSLSAPAPAGGVAFDIATADVTATTADNDYVGQVPTRQSIPAGSQTYTFAVPVIGDTNVESNETFSVTVANVTGTGVTLADGQGVGTITNDDSGIAHIHAIQGISAQSPFNGSVVTIQGVVVGNYQGATGLNGFFVQEEDADADADPRTSEGLFVYDAGSAVAVNVGDVVQVQGTVLEYLSSGTNLTELSPVTSVSVVSSGANVTPAAVNLPVAAQSDLERYEGMRVTLPQALTVVDNYSLGYYGEVGLAAGGRIFNPTHVTMPGASAVALQTANDLRRIVLDDGNSQSNRNPVLYPAPGLSPINTLRVGDTVTNLAGVLDQRFGAYCLQPIGPVSFTKANPRPATPPAVGGTLKVASANLLNYFTTLDTSGTGTARGADSAAEFTRQRDKTINVLLTLNADVVGMMELENNATAAIQDLVDGLNASASAGTYAYINTDVLGTDAIRVALIYKPGTVTPVGSYLTDLNAVFSRPPLAQTFQENSTSQRFTVIVNHFKSKGCSGATGLDADQNDGQGCYNDQRQQQAARLISFINTAVIPTSGDSDVIIIGDLNSYAKEDPIGVLESAGYLNAVNFFNGNAAYSYVFDGQSGYLDHALISAGLLPQVAGVADWHVNADEPIDLDYNDDVLDPSEYVADLNQPGLYDPGPFRASDHDPVVIGLNLAAISADYTDLANSYSVAWHRAPHNLYLGASVTDDAGFALNSDNASDDGVTRVSGQWQPDQTVTLNAQVTGGSGWLTGWFDWNLDGDFDDAGEKAINQAATAGANLINVIVPSTALIGNGSTSSSLPARFRLYESSTEPLRPTAITAVSIGSASGGEVEDYVWNFSPTAVELHGLTVRSIPISPWIALMPLGLGLLLSAGWLARKRRSL
jgi:predicted extracellular nuclease